jgi:hypothetical protein
VKRFLIGTALLLCVALVAAPALALAAECAGLNAAVLVKPPPKPPKPPPKPPKPPPRSSWHHHHHHHHLPPPVAGVAWQPVRYVVVSNQTGTFLTVFARVGDSPTWSWRFAPGEAATLIVDGQRLATSEAYLWATSGRRSWIAYRDEPLVVVPTPYLSRFIDSYTHTFYP